MAPPETKSGPDPELGVLRGDVLNHGSSWAALMICLKLRPPDFHALLEIAGVTHRQVRAFDACADGYSVYEDGRLRGKLKPLTS